MMVGGSADNTQARNSPRSSAEGDSGPATAQALTPPSPASPPAP